MKQNYIKFNNKLHIFEELSVAYNILACCKYIKSEADFPIGRVGSCLGRQILSCFLKINNLGIYKKKKF